MKWKTSTHDDENSEISVEVDLNIANIRSPNNLNSDYNANESIEQKGRIPTSNILLIEHDDQASEEYGPPDAGGSSNSESNTFYRIEPTSDQDESNSQ